MIRTIATALLSFVAFVAAARAQETPPGGKPVTAGCAAPTITSWLLLPGERFEVAGRLAFVIRPERPAKGNPWLNGT